MSRYDKMRLYRFSCSGLLLLMAFAMYWTGAEYMHVYVVGSMVISNIPVPRDDDVRVLSASSVPAPSLPLPERGDTAVYSPGDAHDAKVVRNRFRILEEKFHDEDRVAELLDVEVKRLREFVSCLRILVSYAADGATAEDAVDAIASELRRLDSSGGS